MMESSSSLQPSIERHTATTPINQHSQHTRQSRPSSKKTTPSISNTQSATFPRPTAQSLKRSTAGGSTNATNATTAGTTSRGGGSSSSGQQYQYHQQQQQQQLHHSSIGSTGTMSAAGDGNNSSASMKLSVSMISLQPPNAAQTPEAGMPSMRQERPYNSLKVFYVIVCNSIILLDNERGSNDNEQA